MSTWSNNLGIQLIGTGEQTGTWGTTTNGNFQYVFEEAIVGTATVSFSDANVTLSATQATTDQQYRNLYLNCTGTNTAQRTLTVPTIYKNYVVANNTTGGFSILVTTSSGTGITIPNGYSAYLYVNNTNVVQLFTYQPVMTIPTLSGGNTASSQLVLQSTTGTGTSDSIVFKTGSQTAALTINTSGNATFNSTGAVTVPVGTAGQQPGTPATGMFRFNTTSTAFEGYNGTSWGSIGGGSSNTATGNIYAQANFGGFI